MAHSFNTNRAQRERRTGEYEDNFDGARYGNRRHQEAELKKRDRRIERARNKREFRGEFAFA